MSLTNYETVTINCEDRIIKLFRQDEMFECGKGIIIAWPQGGMTFVPAIETENCGIEFLRKICKELNQNSYKMEQAYWKLKNGHNNTYINIRIK